MKQQPHVIPGSLGRAPLRRLIAVFFAVSKMNEVHDVQPGHIYQPGNKKEVRLVYRILSGPYCGRHQKSFSLTKWGVAGAWDAAQQAKAYMLQTGRLPPSFASPYSRSKLTNASANAIVLSKPLQPPRPLMHSGAIAGGHARAEAAALLASAAAGVHLGLDTTNAAVAAAASRFLPLDTFSAVAAAARSLPPHHAHTEKDEAASALAFSAFSDGLTSPFPSFLPPSHSFPARPAAAPSPPGAWSYLSSVHATLAAAAAAQRASEAESAGAVRERDSTQENTTAAHSAGCSSLSQENSNGSVCASSTADTHVRGSVAPVSAMAEAGDGRPPVLNSYAERVAAHHSELLGLHMLPGAPGPPSPFRSAPASEGGAGVALASSSSTPPATANTGAACGTSGDLNPAAAAATAFTLLQLAEQNAMLPHAKDQQQLNHNALQHFMLLQQLQMMQEKQQKDVQQQRVAHESLCFVKRLPLQVYQPAGEDEPAEGSFEERTGARAGAEAADDVGEAEAEPNATYGPSATASAENDPAHGGSMDQWQNQNCTSPPPDAAQLGQQNLLCRTPDAAGSVSAVPHTFPLLRVQRQHQQQHQHQEQPTQQEPHEQERQDNLQQSGQGFTGEDSSFDRASAMRETLRDLLVAASLQQQRLHQQQLAVAENFHNPHPHIASLAIKGLALGRAGAAPSPHPGLLNLSALASLLPHVNGSLLAQKQQATTDAILTQNSSSNTTRENRVVRDCGLGAGLTGEEEPVNGAVSAEGRPNHAPMSEGCIYTEKNGGFPPQLSVPWGYAQPVIGAKNRASLATAAARAGHCGAVHANEVGPSLENSCAVASSAALNSENLSLVTASAAPASVARIKGLSECGSAVMHHPTASSSQGTVDIEGEYEAMSSCQSGNREECEKEESFQSASMTDTSGQRLMVQSLSPPLLCMPPLSSAAASPLRLVAPRDNSGNACNPAAVHKSEERYEAAPDAALIVGGSCQTLMHLEGEHAQKMSSMTVSEMAITASAKDVAAITDSAALQTFSSPNNTPSRSSGSSIHKYCTITVAEAHSRLRTSGYTGGRNARLSRDTRLRSDTSGRSAGVSSLVGDVLQVGSSMAVENSVAIPAALVVDPGRRIAADAFVGEICNNPLTIREGSTDSSNCTTASASEGPDRSGVFGEVIRGTNEMIQNGADAEEVEFCNSTRSDDIQGPTNSFHSSNFSDSNGSKVKRRPGALLTAGVEPTGASENCPASSSKRTRPGRGAGDMNNLVSSEGEEEKEVAKTRSTTADEKKQIPEFEDVHCVRTLGRHHPRRRIYF